MEVWVIFTVSAAFFQNLRNGLQKSLNSVLSTAGAAYTRFAFGLPLSIIYWIIIYSLFSEDLNWGWIFWINIFVAATSQILAMVSLLRAFSLRGFAIGTAYGKTETIQTAIFTVILLNENIQIQAFIAIFISLIGVVLMTTAKSKMSMQGILLAWREPTALYGLASGGLLGISAVTYRGAALAMEGSGWILPAASALVVALTIQTLIMTIYLFVWEKGELSKVWINRKRCSVVGLVSMLGSVGWFAAMTLQNAAYVRALGQVELIFTFLTSVFIFRERINKSEIAGTILIVSGVIILLLF